MAQLMLTRETESAITTVFTSLSVTIIKAFPAWDLTWVSHQVSEIRSRMLDIGTAIGAKPFIIKLSQDCDDGFDSLSSSIVPALLGTSCPCIVVGTQLGMISWTDVSAKSDLPGPVELCQMSADALLFHREFNNALTVYAKGSVIGYFDLGRPDLRPPTASRFSRRADDYEIAILDNYRERVRFWQTDHWSDRPKRVLFAKKGNFKTEAIFHKDLHEWLHSHLQAQVWSKPRDTTRDELDIVIISPNNRSFVVEIKWLGVNESKTEVDIKDFAEGLDQLAKYLIKQPHLTRGTLVGYDGRDLALFEATPSISNEGTDGCKRLGTCSNVQVHPRAACFILFLENQTASQ